MIRVGDVEAQRHDLGRNGQDRAIRGEGRLLLRVCVGRSRGEEADRQKARQGKPEEAPGAAHARRAPRPAGCDKLPGACG